MPNEQSNKDTIMNELKTKCCNEIENAPTCACEPTAPARYARPRYKVSEGEAEIRLAVDLPGVRKEGVELSVEDGVLELRAQRAWSKPDDWLPLAGSVAAEAYRLRLAIGDDVDVAAIAASMADGVLDLRLPKAEAAKARRIAVS